MLREEIKQLKTGAKELRKFGLTVGGVFLIFGIWFWYRQKAHYPYFLTPGFLLVILGMLWPRGLKEVYVGWMALAFTLGLIVSTVLLAAFFYLVITPLGLVARLAGKDFLNRRLVPKMGTYWLKKEPTQRPPASYERQF